MSQIKVLVSEQMSICFCKALKHVVHFLLLLKRLSNAQSSKMALRAILIFGFFWF